ncbi:MULTISPECIES: LysM peptidoglycan-binding domain-containing protein [unclassified Cyanobium]|uniref:LysM peptidoglycan-binding domain-containing protein n=1 Tax=unclassified Cyanobium TaxID=2627006 RepID=UPI0020CC3873|nr:MULTISPECIES: LysM peptidoglycan-binding domain-containing protein [unclassified Cyanobium]MCP9861202.1 LysM peptidoglycan-binding domain-containing protein [Cyanobium sp. Cruz-8H5]MCP9868451.1 LysM peptidoglycan-binding domain-containing protein [Cyanobium sp. Cruz-8D1]
MVEPTPLQCEASVRLLLPLLQHPRAKAPVILAWHVLEAFIKQRKLLTSRDGGPGQDSGDVLCTGFITRGAELPPILSGPWDWLASDLAWQTNALRPVHQPAPLLLPDPPNPGVPPSPGNTWTPRPRVLQPPVEQGVAWLGDLDALQSPGVLPPQPRAQLAGCSLLTAGFPFGEGGIGRLVQSQLGEAIEFVLKPQRVIVIEPGDSLRVLAERYGTTVQTLRSINPSLLSLDTVPTAAGDTLLSLAGQYGTTVEWLMANNSTLERWGGHTVASGDSLKSLAELYFTTSDTLRLYNQPTYDLFKRSQPLPVGAHLVVPLVRPSTPLDPGQNLLVPLYRPGSLLPFDSWIHLPKARRTAADPDDRSYLDAPEPEPEPEPEPTPEPAP